LQSSIALSSALMAATVSAKHFTVKAIKYFAVICALMPQLQGVTISNCNRFSVICIQ